MNKIIRHFYNAYLTMDLKLEVFLIDYLRMTSFYFLYTLEYLYSLLLVIVTLPKLTYILFMVNPYCENSDKSEKFDYTMPNNLNFNFDYRIVFFFYMCASIPNFLNTFMYLHNKRKEQLQYARARVKMHWFINLK